MHKNKIYNKTKCIIKRAWRHDRIDLRRGRRGERAHHGARDARVAGHHGDQGRAQFARRVAQHGDV